MAVRRNGIASYLANGSLIPGPFTLQTRHEVLDRLLKTQAQVEQTLITEEEIELIRKIWSEDAVQELASELWDAAATKAEEVN